MENKVTVKVFEEENARVLYSDVDKCPICGATIAPISIDKVITFPSIYQKYVLHNFAICKRCGQTFIARYISQVDESRALHAQTNTFKPLESVPLNAIKREFSKKILTLSPSFVEIYNQAYQAEQEGLKQICGMGYRKALEFLIKDFLIHKKPEDSESLKTKDLGKCAADLEVYYPPLKTLASRAAWLGNDETHYTRRHTDYDLETLKEFIEATVLCIDMVLTIDAASQIESKK